MAKFEEINELVQKGNAKGVQELVSAEIAAGTEAKDILEKGLLAGMAVVGEKFKRDEVFVPEVLVAARAMNAGVELLKDKLAGESSDEKGTVVLGTVKGDLHDIGKNLVKIMMEGKGLKVIDLGVDVAPEKFIEAAKENGAKVIACSALLTTTMAVMKDVVELIKESGLGGSVKLIVGGAPVTQDFCDKIGADGYTLDAASAAEKALEFCK